MDEADDLDASASRALSLAAETAERRARLATLLADLAVSSPAAPPRPSKSKGKASAGGASTKAASAPRVKLVKPSRGPVEAPALDRTASGTDRAAEDEASSIAFMQTVLPQHTVRDLEQALRASGGDPVRAIDAVLEGVELDADAYLSVDGARQTSDSTSSTSGSSDPGVHRSSDSPPTELEWEHWEEPPDDGPRPDDVDEFPSLATTAGPGADFQTVELANVLDLEPKEVHQYYMLSASSWPRALDMLLADFEATRPLEAIPDFHDQLVRAICRASLTLQATLCELCPAEHPQLVERCFGAVRGDFTKCLDLLSLHARFVQRYGLVPFDQLARPASPANSVGSTGSASARKKPRAGDGKSRLPTGVGSGPSTPLMTSPWTKVAQLPKPRLAPASEPTPGELAAIAHSGRSGAGSRTSSPAPGAGSARWQTVSYANNHGSVNATAAECRQQAADLDRMYREALYTAHATYRKFGGSAAGVYAERAKEIRTEAQRWDLAGARRLVADRRQMPGVDLNSIDLHGLTAREAVVVVRECLNSWWASGTATQPFRIICGAGTHSHQGKQVLLPAVKAAIERNWLFTQESLGLGRPVGSLLVTSRR